VGGGQLSARLPQTEGWEGGGSGNVLPGLSTYSTEHGPPPPRPALPPRTRLRSGWGWDRGRRPQPPAPPRPPAPHGAPARPRRPPGGGLGHNPIPDPGCLPGALQSAHTSALGPFRDILSGDAAVDLWASVGGAGGGPRRRRRPCCPARLRLGSARPANRPPPGLARNPPCPPAPLALGRPPPRAAPRRPAAAHRSPRPLRGSGPLLQEAAQALPTGGGAAHTPAPPPGAAGRASRRKEAGNASGKGRGHLKGPRLPPVWSAGPGLCSGAP
jgi:hypothetical protein